MWYILGSIFIIFVVLLILMYFFVKVRILADAERRIYEQEQWRKARDSYHENKTKN